MIERFLKLEAAYAEYQAGRAPLCSPANLQFNAWMVWAIKQPVASIDSLTVDYDSPKLTWDCRTYRLAAGMLGEECEALRPRPDVSAYASVPGWLSELEASTLQSLAKDNTVLEVGTWKARSTIAMAATAKHVVTVDHFAGDGFAGVGNPGTQAWENVVRAEAQERVTMMFTPWEIAKRFLATSDFEVIFYDGDHTYEATHNFLKYVHGQWILRTVIAVHDYDNNPNHWGCRKAVDEFVSGRGYSFELYDTLAVLRPSPNNTMANPAINL